MKDIRNLVLMGIRQGAVQRVLLFAFIAIYGAVFALLITKAFTLPITHDESWTVASYVSKSPWEIMMYPDPWPNNHILNTLLTKFSVSMFGTHDWSVRLPNLLFFPIYGWGVYRFLAATLKERIYLILPAALLFVLSPYFLDFFALCRGYGISSALTMLSLSFFVTGFMRQKQSHIWWAVILGVLASYANFTVLVFWAASVCVAALYFYLQRRNWSDCLKKWGVLALISFGYLALIATPIYKMKSTNQFQFWTSKGFYEETIFSVVHNSLSDSAVFTRPDWISKLILIGTLLLWLVGAFVLVKFRFRRSGFQQPLVIVGVILFTAVGVNLLQTAILGDPNLNGRTALFLLPIFTALVVTGMALLPSGRLKGLSLLLAGLIVLVSVQHLTTTIRMKSFKEWRYDAHTYQVMDHLKSEKEGEKVSLKTFWLYQNSFYFYRLNEADYEWLNLQVEWSNPAIDTACTADYYYVPEQYIPQLQHNYKEVKRFDGGHVLMRHK